MPKKLTPMSIRLDDDVKAALEARAVAEDRSLSWVVNRVLRDHFRLDKGPARKSTKGQRA
jgi:predicted transcriptional regulator